MKLVCFVFLSCSAVFAIAIEAPSILSVTPKIPSKLVVKWESNCKSSDLTGFKVRMWEIESEEQGYFNLVNGDQIPGLTFNYKALEPFNAEKIPKTKPREIIVPDREAREVDIDDIKYNKMYEIRALAYKGDEESSLSGPARIQLIKADDATSVIAAQRQSEDSCIASVATHVTVAGESYYHLRNIHL